MPSVAASTGFKFAWLVELLETLNKARVAKALPASRKSNPDYQIVKQWFSKYDSKISRQGEAGYSFLACMFPERLPQRSYAIKEIRLATVFGRALGLGASRARRLNAWNETGDRDFASCVEEIMAECESDAPSPSREVVLEDIDEALGQIAANTAFSSAVLRENADQRTHDQLLAPILRRLTSCEAKWLIRMILKSYSPVQIPERTAMLQFHFLLPSILSIQDSIEATVDFLGQPKIALLPHNPEFDAADAFSKRVLKDIVPRLGIMVKRQSYEKARSIKHCCQMADKRLMSVERKYDGEYCQIHIDRSRSLESCIQIFSKSGKDSTEDRIRLHGAIRDSLLLGRPGCKIKHKCILEGELLVWNRTTATIEPFHKIRRHAMHGRRFLGVETDSPPAADEHLMIVFYDLLVLDHKVFANEPHSTRRQHLKALVTPTCGIAEVAERDMINFGSRRGPEQLRAMLARSITDGWEGFVLKGSNESYFSLPGAPRTIKLKKGYITALGDSADLCIIGGRRDPRLVDEFNLHNVRWTTFYLACLENKAEVVRFGGKPRFKVTDTIDPHGVPRNDILEVNQRGQFMELPFALEHDEFDIEMAVSGVPPPTLLFRKPIVVEVMGAGFDKNSSCDFYTIRFPRLARIHLDRDLTETMTFSELQDMTKTSEARVSSTDSQEDAKWIERLIEADGKSQYVIDKSQSTSPGETPRSPPTITISPVSTKRPKPPVFIRVDTSEVLHEDADAKGLSQETGSSELSNPASMMSTRSKRKLSEFNGTPTPSSNGCSKRRRVALAKDSPRAASSSQVSQVSGVGNARILRPRRDPSMEASQQLVAESSASSSLRVASVREPLAEMRNVSPELQRRSHPRNEPSAAVPWPCKDRGQAPSNNTSSRAVATIRKALQPAKDKLPFLPTPPTSSAESAAAEGSTVVTRKQPAQKQRASVIRSDNGHLQERPRTPPELTAFASPLLLSRSLGTKEWQSGGSQSIQPLLQQSKLAFTYSSSYYTGQTFQSLQHMHVVLVDASDSRAAASDILELGLELIHHSEIETLRRRMVVIFVDYSILESEYARSKQRPDTMDLQASFCAGLEMGPGVMGGYRQRAARVVWDWSGMRSVLEVG